MRKKTRLWPIRKLRQKFNRINFPEYQREPNIWSRTDKQRLIDSIMREFDIASIYLYEDDDGTLDCIDGRQRLGAIMAFLGENPQDDDEGFEYKPMNEIYEDDAGDLPFADLRGKDYEEIKAAAEDGHETSGEFREKLLDYKLSVVKLAGSRRAVEFNLQFTRLNLGMIINSGEKLHAMVGDLRDICFGELGDHDFLQAVGIPTRRYAQQQLAAQILAQVFSVAEDEEYARTRHYDLQRLFKEHTDLGSVQKARINRVTDIMDLLYDALPNPEALRNRALTVSSVLLAWKLEVEDEDAASKLASFLDEFLCRLRWQLGKDLDYNQAYRNLIEFNRDVTQASVERSSVRRRTETLKDYYNHWEETGEIKGDEEYDGNPSEDCRDAD